MPRSKKVKQGRYRVLLEQYQCKPDYPNMTRPELEELEGYFDDPDVVTDSDERDGVAQAIWNQDRLRQIILFPDSIMWDSGDLSWAMETHMQSHEYNAHVDQRLIRAWNQKVREEREEYEAAQAAAAEQSGS